VVPRVMGNLFRDVVQSGRVGLELVSAGRVRLVVSHGQSRSS
jgi:hypothetical protein